ncbi:hypothetical protein FJZ18_03930 [Candidatus Pacearchaeota archaeon]|nr:hypothetical protein [Candidatus Pacearchaeota archaeon]
MKKTLESLIRRAKDAVKKTATALGATAAIATATTFPQQANADVYLTMESQNGLGLQLPHSSKNNPGVDIHIYADNTTESDSTGSIEITSLKAPPCFEYWGAFIMDPYVNYYDDLIIPPSPSRDFFYPKPLKHGENYIGPIKGKRSVDLSNTSLSPLSLAQKGVINKKGLIGIISYGLKSDTPTGKYQFEIQGIAKRPNGTIQQTKGSIFTINIVQDKDYFDKTPLLTQDMNYAPGTTKKVPILRVSGYKKPVQLQASSDLKTWQTIATSPFSIKDYVPEQERDIWAAFNHVDKEAEKYPARFYRLFVP